MVSKFSYLLLGLILTMNFLLAQHIPVGHDHESPTECRGYAASLAWGTSWNDSVCPASELSVYTLEVACHSREDFALGNIDNGEIIAWGIGGADHAAYVKFVQYDYFTNSYKYRIQFVEYSGGIRKEAWLEEAINGASSVEERGEPDYIYKPKEDGWPIKVQNNFDGGEDYGGTLKVRGVSRNSPATTNTNWNISTTIEATMDGQTRNGYKRLFNKWTAKDNNNNIWDYSSAKYTTVTRTDNFITGLYTFDAVFKKEFDVTLQNNFINVGNYGQIKFENVSNNVTYVGHVAENNSASISAPTQTYNGIKYKFSHWSGGASGSSNPKSIYPSDHTAITAHYTGKPINVTIDAYNGDIGDNITLTWPENPNQNVTKYRISRKVKHSLTGTWDPETTLATLNRGTTSYTDYEYTYTGGYTHDLVHYNIRAYYQTENSWSDDSWVNVFGQQGLMKLTTNEYTPNGLPSKFAIKNYPNPFNPETRIAFSVATDARVELSIFNIKGELVQHLVNAELTPGEYHYMWDGRNKLNRLLPTGIYFARMQVVEKMGGKNHLITHRLLLMK